MSDYKITWLTGEKELKPVLYRLTETVKKRRWWWWDKTLYWIESDYGRLGPFDDKANALMYLEMAQRF